MTTTEMCRHEPTEECDGSPMLRVDFARGTFRVITAEPYVCSECSAHLCGCEVWYGHDCEV